MRHSLRKVEQRIAKRNRGSDRHEGGSSQEILEFVPHAEMIDATSDRTCGLLTSDDRGALWG